MPEGKERPVFLALLDKLLERLEERENGVGVVSDAPPTPIGSENQHRTRGAIADVK